MLTADIIGPDLIIVIVVGVIVLLFGGSKLPKLARGLGSASHEFKKGVEEGGAEAKATSSLPPASASAAPQPTAAPQAQPVAQQAPPAAPAAPPAPQAPAAAPVQGEQPAG